MVREDEAVLALCERYGYGAVMDSAARQWRRQDPIGALTVGPAAGMPDADSLQRRIDDALLHFQIGQEAATAGLPVWWEYVARMMAEALAPRRELP